LNVILTLKLIQVGDENRTFLEDGDEVILHGRAETKEFVSIGFGEYRGIVSPAIPL